MTRQRFLPFLFFFTFHLAAIPGFAARTWYVDNSFDNSTYGGDGSESAPFASLAEAEKASGVGDVIVLIAGAKSYPGGIALKDQQSLTGKASYERSPVIIPGESYAVSVTGSANVEGIAIEGGGAGAGIRIEAGPGDVTLTAVRITRTAGDGIVVRGREGTVTLARGLRIATIDARALVVEKVAKLVIAEDSVLESTNAAAVELRDVELDATFASVSATGKFAAGIILEKTRGRVAVNGGTISGARHRAIDIRAAANVSLRNLKLTGNTTEDGAAATDCASDLLVHDNTRCHAALHLHNVENVAVEDVQIEGSAQLGISGRDVRDAAFRRVIVHGAGDELSEHALVFRNLTGEVAFTGCTITRAASRGLYILNDRGTSSISVEDCRFSESAQPLGQQGMLIAAEDSAKIDLRVLRSTFSKIHSAAIHVSADGTSSLDLTIEGNQFEQTGGGVSIVVDERANVKFHVAGNRADGSTTNAINAALSANASTAMVSGVIARNRVGSACASCSGISLRAGGTGTMHVNIHGNEVARVGGPGISAQAQQRSRLDLAITSNVLSDPSNSESGGAIRVQAGALAADAATVCAKIETNKISGTWDPRGVIQLVNRTASTLRLSGPESGADDVATAWLRQKNGGAAVRILRPATPREDAIVAGYECSVPTVR